MYYTEDEVDTEGNENGKIFVGGTSQDTNSDHLREYFSQFGEIENANIMMDNRTGHSRGFGYVKFKNDASVVYAMSKSVHYILNKYVDVRRSNVNLKGRNRRNLRIFVGGVSLDQNEDSLRDYFSQFGKVTDVNLMMDRARKQHRGFAFVGFENESTVSSLVKMHFVQIDRKIVEIKPLEPPKYGRKSEPVASQNTQQIYQQNPSVPEGQKLVKCYATQVVPSQIPSPNQYRLVGYAPIMPGSPYYTPVYDTGGYVYYHQEQQNQPSSATPSIFTQVPIATQPAMTVDHNFPASASGDDSEVIRTQQMNVENGSLKAQMPYFNQEQPKLGSGEAAVWNNSYVQND